MSCAKRGQVNSNLVYWFIGVLLSLAGIAIMAYLLWNVIGPGGDSTVDKGKEVVEEGTVGKVKDLVDEAGTDSLPERFKCSGDDRKRNKELVEKHASQTQDIPVDFALAIAWQESRLRWCVNGEIYNFDEESYGVMQVTPGTAQEVCGSQEDILTVESNIRCGVKILQAYYDTYDDDQTYLDWLKAGCKQYYSGYTEGPDSDLKKTARAYNGGGCGTETVRNYVPQVMEHMRNKPWTEI